jgi:hypothetical protein
MGVVIIRHRRSAVYLFSILTMAHDLRRFLLKLTIFLLPFAAVLAVAAVVLGVSGEFVAIGRALDLQDRSSDVLFGLAYSDPTEHFKMQGVLKRGPAVLALGTSRVMQFRTECFRPGVSFYNAGNGVTRIRHLNIFLDKIPAGREPAVILLGLDQCFFNINFDPLSADNIESRLDHDRRPFDIFTSRWLDVYRDYFAGKFSLRDFIDPSRRKQLGLFAITTFNGFRPDGSYYWGRLISDPLNPKNPGNLDFDFHNTLARIRNGHRRFEYGSEVSRGALTEVDRFLASARSRNIHIVGFLPPFAHRVYERMLSMGNRYDYLKQLPGALNGVFARHGFPLFDLSDLKWLGASDREAIDGYHGSEKAYHRALILMAEDDPYLKNYVRDLDYLRERLDRTQGDHLVFDRFTRVAPALLGASKTY